MSDKGGDNSTSSKVTCDGDKWSNAAEDFVRIEEYDPRWKILFDEEAAALQAVIPNDISCTIHHFGSTAVPGLEAKPIIDILINLPDRSQWPGLVEPLKTLEYVYWEDNPNPDRMFFVKGMPPFGVRRTHHIHVFPSEEVKRRIAFRDALRGDSGLAQRYARLKRSLAAKHRTDREAYSEGKREFVESVLSDIAFG